VASIIKTDAFRIACLASKNHNKFLFGHGPAKKYYILGVADIFCSLSICIFPRLYRYTKFQNEGLTDNGYVQNVDLISYINAINIVHIHAIEGGLYVVKTNY
jgi:hypothetical protein